jgi:uncharacterized protein YggT (Ycf19 family)
MPVLLTIFSIIFGILRFFEIALFVWVVLSWILFFTQRSKSRWRYRQLFSILEQLEGLLLGPLLRLARRILPPRILPREWQMIDLSPIIVLLLIELLRALLSWGLGFILVR